MRNWAQHRTFDEMRSFLLMCVLLLSIAARAQRPIADPANCAPANHANSVATSSSFELPRSIGDAYRGGDSACAIGGEAASSVRSGVQGEVHNNHRVLDKKFVLFQSLNTLAMVADIESTAHALDGKSVVELNPLFGQHPTRARMYGFGIPVDAFTFFLSYRTKKVAPRRRLWELAPAMTIAIHTAAATNNIVASHP
jgi:hypothetical protein